MSIRSCAFDSPPPPPPFALSRRVSPRAPGPAVAATIATAAKRNGFTPLHLAARTGKRSVVKVLLAAARADGRLDVAALLSAKTATGLTARGLAEKNERDDVVALLAAAEA